MPALREKIGQLFMIGIRGEALSGEERLIFEDCAFGGFILFGSNCGEPQQIVELCRSLWDGADPPPFIAIDQEGGQVHRLPDPFTRFPPAAAIGRRGDPRLAYEAGRATALELSLLGINLDFAPVLDVNSNPDNPIIGDRAFGSDCAVVSRHAGQWFHGLRDGGIIPCGKHFPGHGDTGTDSHLDSPRVNRPLNELEEIALPPFRQACRERIESLMTAHVLYPALDSEYPATLSARIMTGLLRRDWGYDGVVFSDDLEMKAVSAHFGAEEAAGLCVRAGVDVLLYGHDLPRALLSFESLCSAAERDPAMRARVEQSHQRIARLKQKHLRAFTGAGADQLRDRIARWDHYQIVKQLQGSLYAL